MKIKTIQAMNAITSLTYLLDAETTMHAATTIVQDLKELKSIEEVYQAKQEKLIKKYAAADDNGEYVTDEKSGGIKILDMPSFMREMNTLNEEEIDPDLKSILKTELPQTIKPRVFIDLDFIIEE